MKRPVYIVAVFVLLNHLSLCASAIDERKIDIYFGNGVWNKKYTRNCKEDFAANCSQEELNIFVQDEIIQGDPALQQKYGPVKLQYNWGLGYMTDILETYYQLKNAGQVNGLQFFALMTLLFNGDPIPAVISSAMYALRESAIAADEQANLMEMWNKYYDKSFQYSHRVLLVSHSQGNLFANRIFSDGVALAGFGDYFANLQVASPASQVDANKGDYVTAFVDPVINPIPGSMASNAGIAWPGHSFVSAYLQNPDTLGKIIQKIKALLNDLDAEQSQWQKVADLNRPSCANLKICKQRIRVEHRWDPSQDSELESEEVFAFDDTPYGKIYKVGDAFVKASEGGTSIDDVFKSSGETICYELKGTGELILPVTVPNVQKPKDGSMTVALRWDSADIDMDLQVDGPAAGQLDIADNPNCPLEHFNLQNSAIVPGTYAVNVANKGYVNSDDLPQIIVVDVKTPDKSGIFGLEITDAAGLNLGHVADIVISEKKRSTLAPVVTAAFTPLFVIMYDNNSTYKFNVTKSYAYDIISRLPQLIYGPISGAAVELYTLAGYKTDAPLYSGMTTEGGTVYSAGIISVPSAVSEKMEDNALFVISAQGGEDIDADDNMRTDALPTPNYGAMHGILSGKAIKGSFKVNVLTEMAYQVLVPTLGAEEEETVRSKLDEVATLLFKSDVNGDMIIDSEDLSYWTPSNDKPKLVFDYGTNIEPIVQKIYAGYEIYDDVMDLLYPNKPPVSVAGNDINMTSGESVILDGSGSYDPDGYIVEYLWRDKSQTYCRGSEPTCTMPKLWSGEYFMTLRVRDDGNLTAEDTIKIIVKPESVGSENIDSALLECIDRRLNLSIGIIPSEEELLTVESLTCSHSGISDISLIAYLKNLKSLSFIDNNISDISPLAGLSSLERLNLSENPISDIAPLGNLNSLMSLDLHGIPISDHPVLSGLKNVTYLSVTDTNLTSLSTFRNMSNLEGLYISNNRLGHLDGIESLTNLQWVYIDNEQITDLSPLRSLTNLVDFVAWGCPISNMAPLADLQQLLYLSLDDNQISELPDLSAMTNLEWLNLETNKIADISGLSGLRQLKYLDLGHNAISDVAPLAQMQNLLSLALQNNRITDITALAGLPALKYLYLDGNNILDFTVLQNLLSVSSLSIGETGFSQWEAIEGLKNLTSIGISGNNLSDLSALAAFKSLTYIGAAHNNIADLTPLESLTNLGTLNLEDNAISDLTPLQNLGGLRMLMLDQNCISDFTPVNHVPFVYGKENQKSCKE